MKKLIDTATNTTICEITSNHSMTLDEAIKCAGGEILNATEDNVIIDGVTYCYDDLDLVYSPDAITPSATGSTPSRPTICQSTRSEALCIAPTVGTARHICTRSASLTPMTWTPTTRRRWSCGRSTAAK